MWRRMEAVRDRIMYGAGTDEPWFQEVTPHGFAATWRKPLSIEEVNQMAATAEVRERLGRA